MIWSLGYRVLDVLGRPQHSTDTSCEFLENNIKIVEYVMFLGLPQFSPFRPPTVHDATCILPNRPWVNVLAPKRPSFELSGGKQQQAPHSNEVSHATIDHATRNMVRVKTGNS